VSKPLVERLRQIEEAHLSPGETLQKGAAGIGRDPVEVVVDYASEGVACRVANLARRAQETNRRTNRPLI
jgi:hypothetical protein